MSLSPYSTFSLLASTQLDRYANSLKDNPNQLKTAETLCFLRNVTWIAAFFAALSIVILTTSHLSTDWNLPLVKNLSIGSTIGTTICTLSFFSFFAKGISLVKAQEKAETAN